MNFRVYKLFGYMHFWFYATLPKIIGVALSHLLILYVFIFIRWPADLITLIQETYLFSFIYLFNH